jgi:hypothetical protein
MSDQNSPTKEVTKVPTKELRKVPDRMIVDARDVMNITGRNIRSSQRILKQIREAYGKTSSGLVTRQKFCTYCGLKEEDVKKYLEF